MSDGLSRRDFIQRSAAAGAGVVLIGSTEMLVTTPAASAAPAAGPQAMAAAAGYGPLVADPAGRLALPKGFSYKIVTQAGVTKLESGEFTPRNHDGTATFEGKRGGTVLVNNHEIREPFTANPLGLPVPHLEGLTYDPGAAGGCTIVEVDAAGNRVAERVGVAGTSTNCAGGETPWGTWLTCEETEQLAAPGTFEKDHGYVFEVDPVNRAANMNPQPIKALGRFAHEAVAVDPALGDIYLTEDASTPTGLLYRWKAPKGFRREKGSLRRLKPTDGVLAAMRAVDSTGAHVLDLSLATAIGTTYAIQWVPVPDRDARTTPTRLQLPADQVTRSKKLEGAWWKPGGRGCYIVSSYSRETDNPGISKVHDGQVWFYDSVAETLQLQLLFTKNPDPTTDVYPDGPDNISVSPYGGVILAEDGEGIQHLVGVSASGTPFPMARNDFQDATKNVEFTGPNYSPDRKILFANIQEPGYMFAITGPWRQQK